MSSPLPVKLAFEHIASRGHATQRIVFLHGMLGRGNNLRTVARRFLEQRPTWDAWLVDLRGHGASPKGSPQPSLTAAATDVVALCAGSMPVRAIVGHSFGGKVALEAARQVYAQGFDTEAPESRPLSSLTHIVTLDSNPGVRTKEQVLGPDSAVAVIELLRALPTTHASRAAFIDAVEKRGQNRMLSQWLAQSTEPLAQGGIRFALDLDELYALLLSYFGEDLWPLLEQPPSSLRIHLIIGDRSSSYSSADRARAQALALRNTQVTCDVLPTDHWVHAEDPDGLLQRLWAHLPS